MAFESADRVQDEQGRQYHIGLGPGDVAPWVVLVGDPARVDLAAAQLDVVGPRVANREFVSVTGKKGPLDVTILSTGIGCDNTEIAVVELLNCRRDLTLIRAGSCGALQPGIGLSDLIVSTGAVRLESTSLAFVDEGYPAIAHHEAILALTTAASRAGVPFHVGITAAASGFYGWQGRKGQIIEPKDPEIAERLAKQQVVNFEMETSTLFTLASLAKIRAGCVCTVFANRPEGVFIDPQHKDAAQTKAVGCALDAIAILAEMDASARPYVLQG